MVKYELLEEISEQSKQLYEVVRTSNNKYNSTKKGSLTNILTEIESLLREASDYFNDLAVAAKGNGRFGIFKWHKKARPGEAEYAINEVGLEHALQSSKKALGGNIETSMEHYYYFFPSRCQNPTAQDIKKIQPYLDLFDFLREYYSLRKAYNPAPPK